MILNYFIVKQLEFFKIIFALHLSDKEILFLKLDEVASIEPIIKLIINLGQQIDLYLSLYYYRILPKPFKNVFMT